MLNPRQEKFIALYASGQTAAKAYGAAYGRAGHGAEASGARLLRNAEVQAHLRELRAKASQEAALTVADLLGYLREMFETPIAALDENHPHTCRMTVTKTGQPGKAVRTVRIVEKDSPLAILQEMARLVGLGKKPAAKLGRAKGQPRAKDATVAELIASLGVARREVAALPAL
jgi:phage terminase small subunit